MHSWAYFDFFSLISSTGIPLTPIFLIKPIQIGKLKFIWKFIPDIFEFWEDLTLIVEAFLKELLNTVHISVKIPEKKKNTELYKHIIKVMKSTAMTNFYHILLTFY